ncbi:alpha/beta hydrolase [Allosphingosinicella sp.]|jgi:hypothetical protein|uniref:alpha/beta hydrolase n=1 Tax=Allosphingosinicella sp. TaxID=2823234 RepID=UPI002EFFBF1C
MPLSFTTLARLSLIIAAAAPLAACSVQMTEQQLIRPIAGGSVAQAAITAAAPSYSLTDHSIAASDGARLHGILLRQPGARATILYFGGNGYTIERFGAATAAYFARLGVDLMIVDHRGYGLSEGRPTAALLASDGLAAFDYLRGLGGSSQERIIVHGQSLGSFTAGHVAAHRETAGAVLESSVTTTEDWVRSQRAPVRVTLAPALRGRGNLANMPLIGEPLLLLVGRSDRTTPPSLSEALYRASPLPAERKTLVVVPGAGHNDALLKAEAFSAYRRFLDQVLR